jgi:cytoskeletal protein CcmA (bactofilin family)
MSVFGNKKQKASNRIDSLIGLGTRISGDVVFEGGLRVDGEVLGNVSAAEDKPGTLVLSEKARICGAIRVAHLVLNGTVEGPIHAEQYLELQAKCRVVGDVHYSTLEMHPGAVVEGRLIPLEQGAAPAPAAAD